MEFTDKELMLIKLSLMRQLNFLKSVHEETPDLELVKAIEEVKVLINKIIEK